MAVACQVPLSMEFPRQEYWTGLPFPPPGDLPHPGIKPLSPVPPALAGEAGDISSIPGSRRFPGGGNGNPVQYSCLGKPMGRGAW